MTRVFVNGVSAKSGGGRSILTNFLKVANQIDDEFEYFVAVPNLDDFQEYESSRVKIFEVQFLSKTFLIPIANTTSLPHLAKKTRSDIIFNVSDIPMRTNLKQIFLFDWPYAAFPESPAWGMSSYKERLIRYAKLFFFRSLLNNVDIMIAQNEVLADCLTKHYGLTSVSVVTNAVSLDNFEYKSHRDFKFGNGTKLLCLSRYYSHKNLEIFIPLAKLIKNSGKNIKIVTTIDEKEGLGAANFLNQVRKYKLDDIILNVGSVPMKEVPSLYRQTDALILPTLLESFSGTYVEAMFHKHPILTSNLPFARGVCGEAAYYFNPMDHEEIFTSICEMLENTSLTNKKLSIASETLTSMLTWEQAYKAFIEQFRTAMMDNR